MTLNTNSFHSIESNNKELFAEIAEYTSLLLPLLPKNANIAIDGPIATGKDTIGEMLESLGLLFVNAGDFYRSIAARFKEYAYASAEDREEFIERLLASHELNLNLQLYKGNIHYIVNDIDVTDNIGLNETSNNVSLFSKIESVQDFVIHKIQEFSKKYRVILAGRVMGIYVMPEAMFHIELDAPLEIRAERRYKQLVSKGGSHPDYATLLEEVTAREEIDQQNIAYVKSKRTKDTPHPKYHIRIDTTGKNEYEVFLEVLKFMYNVLSTNK